MTLGLAACFSALLIGNPDSSHHFKTYHHDSFDRKDAEFLVRTLFEEMCPEVPEIMNSNCRNLMKNTPYSRACMVETRVGYFFLTRDMLDGVHVIFNRWD